MRNGYKKGFTLVELSIVLVIIGLLIGGILVAQSLIDSTKIQTLTRAIGQYDAAVGTFKDRFGDLPGDSIPFGLSTVFGITSSVGDGSGTVTSHIGGVSPITGRDWVGETAAFWLQLSQTGLKNEEGGEYNPTASSGINAGEHAPGASIGSSTTVVLAYGEASPDILGLTSSANMYIIADCGAMSDTTLNCNGGVSGPDGLAVDTKLDDGVGDAGDVRNIDESGALTTWAEMVDGTSEAYDPTDTEDSASMLFIRMGAATGVNY